MNIFENLGEEKATRLYNKFLSKGLKEDEAFGEVYSIECNMDNRVDFLDLEIGDKVVAYDENSSEYAEHIIEITHTEYQDDFITDTNPKGLIFYGIDLDYWNEELQDYEEDGYITRVYEGNYICLDD